MDLIDIKSLKELEKEIFPIDISGRPEKPHIDSIVPLHPNLRWKKWLTATTGHAIRNTASFMLEKLHYRVMGYIVKNGKLEKVLRINDPHTPKQYVQYMKELSPALKWPGTAQGMRLDKNFWKHNDIRIMGCILKRWSQKDNRENIDKPGYLNDFYGRFMSSVSQKWPLPDGFYFISPTDQLVLRKDGKEPLVDVVGGLIPLKSHNFSHYYPIINSSTHVDYADIPLPTYDDWLFVRGKAMDAEKANLDWNKKKPIAVFRGSSSGCGFNEETNMRLKAAALSEAHPDLLDAGITTWTVQAKIHRTGRLGYIDRKKYKKVARPIPFVDQSQFKYILHIDGNVAAYRLGVTLLLGSCILLQDTGSRVWFQHMMKPGVHYIPIKEDLSDLLEKIEWCRAHDDECRQIAEDALELGRKIMTKDAVVDYFAATLWALAGGPKASKSASRTKKNNTKHSHSRTRRSKRTLN